MDSSHLGLIHHYNANNTSSGSSSSYPARPIPTRSQTTPQPQEFEFSLPSVRPGLAKIGRRISEMSDNFLYESDVVPDPGISRSASRMGIQRIPEEKEVVPFMGDEPVFCPFCEKPLPPGLLPSHSHPVSEVETFRKSTPSMIKKESIEMTKATSAPEASKSLMTALPVTAQPAAKAEPRTTSVELAKPVRAADEVDIAASKVPIDTEDLRKWAKVAGIELDLPLSKPKAETEAEKSVKTESKAESKPFPKLAPPPEDQSRGSSRNSSRFGFFGKGKSAEEDDESDDDMAGAGGYARLDAPASPEREEKELAPLEFKERREVVEEASPEEEPEPAQPASEDEIRSILKDVLGKVNAMSKSHTDILNSHNSLLTTLKIARSNLAMAEANAEMLEEQIKRQQTPANPTRPTQTPTSAMGPPPVPKAGPSRTSTPAPLSDIKTTPNTTTHATRHSTESNRPQSIQIPSANNPRTPVSASSESGKGVFGFWSRNKDKVGEFLANLPDTTPTAERSSFDFARSPPSSAMSQSISTIPEPYGAGPPGLNRSKTVHGRVGGSDSMQRSSSYTNVRNNILHEPATAPRVPSDAYSQELARLRTAQSTAQSKIDSMSKELADLKKGKIEMEAELENLSQALFEEANKMVADERKKRAELEESLKEVKEEREALRETIKVLGGQVVDEKSNQGDTDTEAEVEEGADVVGKTGDFQPRDLDKHYEALRKSIHHVADSQWEEEEGEGQSGVAGLAQTTEAGDSSSTRSYLAPSTQRRHSLHGISSPEPSAAPALHDPWADSTTTGSRKKQFAVGSSSPTSSREAETESSSPPRDDKLDELDSYMDQLQAQIELESPKREKVNL